MRTQSEIRRTATGQQHAASAPATSAVALASAGSGKTRVLIGRALRLLLGGARPDGLLCLTYTKAAAAEMANRLRRALAAWAVMDDDALGAALVDIGEAPTDAVMARARGLFPAALEAPGGVKVQTVHAFCQGLLARFPIEAGVPPGFQPLDDPNAAAMISAAFREALADPALSEAVGRLAAAGERKLRPAVDDYLGERARLQAAAADRDRTARGLATALDLAWPVPEAEDILASVCAPGDDRGLDRLAAALGRGSGGDRERGAAVAAWLALDAPARLDGLADYAAVFLTGKTADCGRRELRQKIVTKKAEQGDPAVVEIAAQEASRLQAGYAAAAGARAYGLSLAALDLAAAVEARYRAAKDSAGRLDYDDLVLKACAFLERDGGARWAHYKLDRGVDHILVDEAQDNNPDQWRVIDALAAPFFDGGDAAAGRPPRTLFIVGDRKQSIYGFQRAAPAALERKVQQLEDWSAGAGQGPPPKLQLNVNFRTTAAVLNLVDSVAKTDKFSIGETRHEVDRIGAPGRVEVWPALAAAEDDPPAPWTPPDPRAAPAAWATRMAAVTAAVVKRWVAEETPLADGRPIRFGDVLVLVRKRVGFSAAFARACAAAGVPTAGADRIDLDRAMAAIALRAACRWLASPTDDLALAMLLKSPLFGFREDQLFAAAHARRGTLRAALADRSDFAETHAALQAFERAAQADRPFELLTAILGARGRARLRAAYGADADDPIDELLGLALSYERARPPSLLGFLAWLDAGGAEARRDPAAGAGDAVRLMTVHAAKGLEAPAVILIDGGEGRSRGGLMWPLGDDGPALWRSAKDSGDRPPLGAKAQADEQAAEDEEADRLLYVAMTRARDWFCFGGWPKSTRSGAPTRWRGQIEAGLSALGGVAEADFAETYALADHGPFHDGGVMRRRMAGKPPPSPPARPPADADAPPPGWIAERPRPTPASRRLHAPSRLAPAPSGAFSPTGGGAAARRRGVLIHALLERLPDVATDRRKTAAGAWLRSRAPDLAAADRDAMVAAALTALAEPDAAPFFGSGGIAEASIIGTIPTGGGPIAISGRIDRLRIDGRRAWLLDFKTDRAPPEDAAPAAHVAQLALYAAAVGSALGSRAQVETALLWTTGPRLQRISPASRIAALDGLGPETQLRDCGRET